MASVTVYSDFGAPKIKSVTVSPSICHEVMVLDAMILVFWMLSFKPTFSLSTFTFPFHALEKEMATHSSVFAWRIPGTGEPGVLPSVGSHRVGHDWSDLAAAAAAAKWVSEWMNESHSVVSNSLLPHGLTDREPHQSPLSMEFFRQEYWNGLPFSSSGGLPNPGIELGSPAL